jgi:hypothetical protein
MKARQTLEENVMSKENLMFARVLFGLLVCASLLASGGRTQAASILTFPPTTPPPTGTGSVGSGQLINAPASTGYGDNLAGTPNVVVDFPNNGQLWNSGYGDLTQLVLTPNAPTNTIAEIKLTAAATYVVALTRFEVGGWNHTDRTAAFMQVIVDGLTVYNVLNFHVEGDGTADPDGTPNGHTDVDFASPLVGSVISVKFDSGADGVLIGIDNISFFQMPEPSAAALTLAGISAIVVRRQRARIGRPAGA